MHRAAFQAGYIWDLALVSLICTTLRGQIKGKVGIQLKYIPEKRDTAHNIGGYPFRKNHIGKLIPKSFSLTQDLLY